MLVTNGLNLKSNHNLRRHQQEDLTDSVNRNYVLEYRWDDIEDKGPSVHNKDDKTGRRGMQFLYIIDQHVC